MSQEVASDPDLVGRHNSPRGGSSVSPLQALPHYQSCWPHVIDSGIALPVTMSCLFCLDEALPDHHLMQETAGCSAVSIEINS